MINSHKILSVLKLEQLIPTELSVLREKGWKREKNCVVLYTR